MNRILLFALASCLAFSTIGCGLKKNQEMREEIEETQRQIEINQRKERRIHPTETEYARRISEKEQQLAGLREENARLKKLASGGGEGK